MVRCASKNGYENDMRLKEIGLGCQNMITILGSMVSITWGEGGLYDHFSSKNFEESGYSLDLDLLTILY